MNIESTTESGTINFWTWPVNPIVHEHLTRITPEAARI